MIDRYTRRWRRDVWRSLAKEFKPAEIPAGMVFAAVFAVGTDPEALSALTGLSGDYVKKVLKRLRSQRVLVGQKVRTSMLSGNEFERELGAILDIGVAVNLFSRPPDPKRSAAQRARAPETRARGPRGKVARPEPGAEFSPQVVKSNPLYGLAEWDTK